MLFERIVVGAQHLTVLEKVSRFAILAPVTGILTNLFVAAQERLEEKKSDLNDFVERVASSRIDVACLEYLAHFVTGEVSSKPDLPSQAWKLSRLPVRTQGSADGEGGEGGGGRP